MNFINRMTHLRKGGMYLTLLLVVISLLGLSSRGLNLGIDFTGGYITEFSTQSKMEGQSISQNAMQSLLEKQLNGKFVLSSVSTDQLGASQWLVRQAHDRKSNNSQQWLNALEQSQELNEKALSITLLDSDFIDSQIGEELINQGGLALLTALLIILFYLAVRFEWRFALGAIIALFHDVIVVIGIFAWSQLEFNLTVLASLLAIIGYSLNDSIIVADRIRELMKLNQSFKLDELINRAIHSTLARTLITSGTTLATIICVWSLAGAPLYGFSVALFFGIILGTISSVCLSSTLPEIFGLDVNYYLEKEKSFDELMAKN